MLLHTLYLLLFFLIVKFFQIVTKTNLCIDKCFLIGQMSVPPQITNGTMGQNPQAQGMPEMGMIQGLQPQIHAMTMQQGQHMQYQAQPQQVQVVQVKSVPEEPEGRKSPEVAELISFD